MIQTENKFTKVAKKYSLNRSYFKFKEYGAPDTILEIAQYTAEHGELPFEYHGDNWVYDAFIEKQKRERVYNSQFFTPPNTAKQLADVAEQYIDSTELVTDACCGFGQLMNELAERRFTTIGFDVDRDLCEIANKYFGNETLFAENKNFKDWNDKVKAVVSNPPYEVPALTEFLNKLYENLEDQGVAVLLIPKGFVDKERPKKLVQILDKFNVIHREDMQEEFALTKIRAEIVVLEK